MNTNAIRGCCEAEVGLSLITDRPILLQNSPNLPSDVYLAEALTLNKALSGSTLSDPNEALVKQQIYSFEPETLAERDKVNARLAKEGRPPIDLTATTREIEKIANDPSLTDKEKRKAINEVRKRLGLSKGEMKRLFTKRLEKIYAEAVRRLEAVRGVNDPLVQRLRQNQKLYKSMYKPGGCIKKMFKGIGSFFKNTFKAIGKTLLGVFNPRNWFRLSFWRDVVAPVAMNFIPALGPLISTAYRWGLTAYRWIQTAIEFSATFLPPPSREGRRLER